VTTSSPSSSSGKPTHITSGVKVKGQITGQAEIVIDGEVEGSLNVQSTVVVGSDGVVNGDISAKSVTVEGKVLGNVRASDTFSLQSSGRIEGDVTAPRVVIAEGAFFKGNVEMTGGR